MKYPLAALAFFLIFLFAANALDAQEKNMK
jgi:hypothetical protein